MVEVLHYEKANKNRTIGYADIRVPINKPTVLIFRKVPHVQSGTKRWFTLPTFQRQNEKEESAYIRFCEFEMKANNEVLLGSIADKVKEFCKENGIEMEEMIDFEKFPEQSDKELPF